MASPQNTFPPVELYETHGMPIVRMPLEVFPSFYAYVYLLLIEDMQILVDTGSGFGRSNQHLEAGLQTAGERLGKPVSLDNLTHILITHSHIDHFGGLHSLRPRTSAKVGIHELDYRTITNYEERLTLVTHRLSNFLWEAGVTPEEHQELLNLYRVNKNLFQATPVDFTYEAVGMQLGPLQMLHVPGHCAGQTIFRLYDYLLSGDHVLSKTTPHMAPASLTHNTGLGHYLASLNAMQPWIDGVTLTLPAHEDPIRDLPARMEAIRQHHTARLEKVLTLLDTPQTIAEISYALFRRPKGYDSLLAIEEAGAHLEYLYQRGRIRLANLEDLENARSSQPIPLKYIRL
jgi:glyoxylase-like metal-dependent hydrolase (beta-lactamase superfamily II)